MPIRDYRPFTEDDICSLCAHVTTSGFGLAGGGYGPYTYCEVCRLVTSKSPAEDDEPLFGDAAEEAQAANDVLAGD